MTHDEPAELLTTFIGGRGNDALLEEYDKDGNSYILRARFFKALQGFSEQQNLDLTSLIG